MHLLKRVSNLLLHHTRSYVKKASIETVLKCKSNNEFSKPVQQESMRYVHPFARINICSDISVNVSSADLHAYPNGNALIVQLCSHKHMTSPVKMDLHVTDDERNVTLLVKKTTSEPVDLQCVLKVPLRAELHIESQDAAQVSHIYSDEVSIVTEKDILVQELHARKIRMYTETGNIQSKGLLLGKNTDIESKEEGHIQLDRVQGDKLRCSSNLGGITVNSCYVEHSKFETQTGSMELKNVHKKTEVFVHQQSNLKMTGFHGNLFVRSNGGCLNLQLSELEGENIVIGENIKDAKIYISDAIEENTHIEVTASPITLDESLLHLTNCVTSEKHTFELATQNETDHKLLIAIKGGVMLGKLSWADSLMATMNRKEK